MRFSSKCLVVVAAVLAWLTLGTAAASAGPDEWGFRGLLRDGARQPVSGATVEVRAGATVLGTDQTDAKGRWGPIQVPGPGSYLVVAVVGDKRIEVPKELADSPTALRTQNIVISTTESSRATASLGAQLLQRAAAGLNLGLLIGLAAIGLSLVFGTSRFTNFAHGENITFGGITGFVLAYVAELPLLLVMPIALVAGGAFGYLQDLLIWRPLRHKGVSLVTLMISSIGVSLALRSAMQYFFGNAARSISREDWGTIVLGPVTMPVANYASMAISLVALGAVGLWLMRSRVGKATRAIANNSALASATGIDVDAVTRVVWVVSGALAALSGVLLGMFNQVSHDMGVNLLLLLFAAVILGGLGTAFGALLGALVVGLCTEVLVLWIPTDMKYVGGLAILIVVLLVRPQGILGRRERIG